MLPLQDLHGAEERRRESPDHNRPLPTQFAHQSSPHIFREPHKSGTQYDPSSLSRLPRHQGGVHSHTYPSQSSEIPSILSSKSTVLLPNPPLRSLLGTVHIHEDPLLAHPPPSRPGNIDRRIFRRYSSLASIGSDAQPPPHNCHHSPTKPRICSSPTKVLPSATPSVTMVRHSLVWPDGPLECPARISGGCHETSTTTGDSTQVYQEGVGGLAGQAQLRLPGAPPSQDILPTAVQGTPSGTCGSSRHGGTSPRLPSPATPLLDNTTPLATHSAVSIFGSHKSPLDRRLYRRVGSIFRRQLVLPRSVAISRPPRSHKYSGDARCQVGSTTLRSRRLPSGVVHRQRGGALRANKTSGEIHATATGICTIEQVVCGTPSPPLRHSNTITPECGGGRSEPHASVRHGVAPAQKQLSRSDQVGGSRGGRSLRDSSQHPSPTLRDSLPTPKSDRHQRPIVRLEQVSIDLPIPPCQPVTSGSPTPHHVQRQGDSGGALGPLNTVVPSTPTTRQRSPPPDHGGVSTLPPREGCPLIEALQKMDRISFLRHILLQNSSADVVETMIASYRKSSNHQHEVAWTALKNWLSPLVNVITVQTMLDFFQYLFAIRKLAPNTIMNYRNSLSWPLKEAFDLDLHRDEFSKLMKGFFHLKPPQPASVPEWDLGQVLTYYENLAEPLSNRQLFFKSLFLLALATGNRCSEMSAFCRDGLITNNSGITIPLRPHFLYKNQTLRRTPPPIQVPYFHYPLLCPVAFLKRYLESCSPSDNSRALFVHPTSFTSLSAGRIGYWLVQAIRAAHANRPVVKPHDVRKLAYSVNWARKTDLQAIVQHGFWASAHPFINNYLVSLPNPLPHFIAAGTSV